MHKLVIAVALLVLVTACNTQTSVQGQYISMRDACQEQAEARSAVYSNREGSESVKDRNAELVSLFSDCMFERGWTVGTPKRKDGKDTASIIPDPQHPQNQSSRAAAPVARVPSPAYQPIPQASIIPTPQNLPAQTTARPSASGAPARYMPVENQQIMRGSQMPVPVAPIPTPAPVSRAAPNSGMSQFYSYPSDFKADSGVGVGASVKPGREFSR